MVQVAPINFWLLWYNHDTVKNLKIIWHCYASIYLSFLVNERAY